MFWRAITKIHQALCSDPFRFKRHPETIIRREPGRVYVECLRCGHCTTGIRIGNARFRRSTQYVRHAYTWVKPKQRHKFQVQTFAEFKA